MVKWYWLLVSGFLGFILGWIGLALCRAASLGDRDD